MIADLFHTINCVELVIRRQNDMQFLHRHFFLPFFMFALRHDKAYNFHPDEFFAFAIRTHLSMERKIEWKARETIKM